MFFNNCFSVNNHVGLYVRKGGNPNSSHGSWTGGSLNHCQYAFWGEEIEYGFIVANTCIFEGYVLFDRCTGVTITDGIFDPNGVQLQGGNRNYIRGNYVPNDYLVSVGVVHNYQSVADNTVLIDNFKANGTFVESGTT